MSQRTTVARWMAELFVLVAIAFCFLASSAFAVTILRWPTDFSPVITSSFGWRDTGLLYGSSATGVFAMHEGIDMIGNFSTKIRPALPGVVSAVKYSPDKYGNYIEIEHDNGYLTRYAHLSRVDVKKGQKITRFDTTLGLMGSTGNSTGVHLHFELYKDGMLQNTNPSTASSILPGVLSGSASLSSKNRPASKVVTPGSYQYTQDKTRAGINGHTYEHLLKYYNGSVLLKSIIVVDGAVPSASYAPKKTGYTFAGWYSAKSGGTKVTKVTANRSVYARYTINKYTTKYYNGSSLVATKTANYNTSLINSYAPKKTGYTFIGWYNAKSGGSKVTRVSGNKSVYARYKINQYTTNYYSGSTLYKTVKASYNANLTAGPKKTGYTFLGWFTSKTGGTKVTKVTANRTIYAHYKINQYTVKYYNGSTLTATGSVKYKGAPMAGPKKTGYTFLGWFTSKIDGAKISSITKTLTLYARYKINQYTTKYYNGATLLKSVTAKYNSALSKGIAPQKSGYRFAGWYSAKTGGTKVTKVTANRTVYARYIKQISVSYHSAEGILIKKVTVDTGSLPNDLLVPLPPAGCEFIGWYSAPTANFPEGELVTILTGNQSLFARYRRIDSLEPVFVGAEEG